MAIKHIFVSAKADKADDSLVRPSDWNNDHTIDSGVDFNDNPISNLEYVDFNLTPTVTGVEGRLFWDATDGTLNLGMPGGNVDLKIGQGRVIRAINKTGSTIPKGSVVYVNGAQGNRPTIALADADTEATAGKTIGVTAEELANNNNGYVIVAGLVKNLNTNAYSAGTTLYLSSTAGEWTDTAPVSPKYTIRVGYVITQSANVGVVLVSIHVGSNLETLHDVDITSVADGNILQYDSATQTWVNKTFSQLEKPYVIKSENYTITTADYDVEFDTAGVTATLENASGHNHEYRIDNSSSGNITIASNGGNIQGETSQILPTQSSVIVISNGTNWRFR